MTTRTQVKTHWIPGTRAHRQAAPLPVVNKPFTIADEDNATLGDWLNCYGYLLRKPGSEKWLIGLVPPAQIEQVAAIVRRQLTNAKPSFTGKALAISA